MKYKYHPTIREYPTIEDKLNGLDEHIWDCGPCGAKDIQIIGSRSTAPITGLRPRQCEHCGYQNCFTDIFDEKPYIHLRLTKVPISN